MVQLLHRPVGTMIRQRSGGEKPIDPSLGVRAWDTKIILIQDMEWCIGEKQEYARCRGNLALHVSTKPTLSSKRANLVHVAGDSASGLVWNLSKAGLSTLLKFPIQIGNIFGN